MTDQSCLNLNTTSGLKCTPENTDIAFDFQKQWITNNTAAALTDVVLLDFVDVAVDGRVAKEDQHHRLAISHLHHMRRVSLQGVWRCWGRFPWQPGAPGNVEDPHLICHVSRSHFQLPAKHVDVILHGGHTRVWHKISERDCSRLESVLNNTNVTM